MVLVLPGGEGQVLAVCKNGFYLILTKHILERQNVRRGFHVFRIEPVQLIDVSEDTFELPAQTDLFLFSELEASQQGDLFNIE